MNITILTVDTDYTRTLLNSKLEEQNHTVISGTNNYEEALSLYKTYLPDIIILDIDLGDTSKGLSFLTELLEIDPSAQIIALSTFFQDTTKARLLKKGIDRLVMKPYQPAHIWEQIDDICKNNDMTSLRNDREKLLSDISCSNDTYNKGNQLNNQILSLRNQILKSRNLQENKEDEFILDSDIEKNNNTYKTRYDTSNSNSDINDNEFTLDFSPIEESNKHHSSYLDNDKTNISDKSQDTSISFYDTQTDECISKSYLGLPIFIDREKTFNSYDDPIEDSGTYQVSTDNTSKGISLRNILKKKGGK